jgi:hypothetical protein
MLGQMAVLSSKLQRLATRTRGDTRRRRIDVKIVMMVLGVLLVLVGCIWILQGINVLPGSFMTGQMQWAVYGAIAVVIGVLLVVSSRRKSTTS